MSESVLTSIALLGSGRGGELPRCPNGSLTEIWPSLNSDNLLQAAALEECSLATGRVLAKGKSLPMAPPDERAPIPLAVGERLSHILEGNHVACLGELLDRALAGNFRAPNALVPVLLEYGQRHREMRADLRGLLCARGEWLSQLRSRWDWLSTFKSDAEDLWELGSPEERVHWLEQMRQLDLSAAIKAIQESWKGEEPSFKVALIEASGETLCESDEVWLEPALSDSRKEVRHAATVSLLKIPSAFRERSRGRVLACLRLKRKTLEIEAPEEFDASWKADGIREKAPTGTGARAWWLRQLLARVPLGDWLEMLGAPAEELFSLKISSDWKEALHLAWLDSAKAHPIPSFVPALVKIFPQNLNDLLQQISVEESYEILDKLPAELVLSQLVRLASPAPKNYSCLKVILKSLLKDKVYSRPEAQALALCLPSESIADALATISKQKTINTMTEEFARTLEFRQSYLKHLTT